MSSRYSPERRRLAGYILLAGGLWPALRLAAQTVPEGGMRRVSGNVLVNGTRAAVGTPVRAGDTVQTGPGALAVFAVGQDAFLMRANSSASFAGQDTALDALRLITGKLLGVFGKGGGRQLSTATATMGIRGTGAYLEVEPMRTYFCLCYGTAEVATASGSARDVYSTEHHESPRYIYNDGRARPIVMANVANHTDDELIMLEALVGRRPPPGFMASPYRY